MFNFHTKLDWPKIAAVLSVAILLMCLNAVLVMWCWNLFLIPAITGINEIEFIQALGLTGLCSILFKDNGFKVSK